MKDRLEEFIIKNKESFDFYEPNENVWDKIQTNSNNNKIVKLKYRNLLIRVAAFFVIFIGSYYFHDFLQKRENNQLSFKNRIKENLIIIPELEETEAFYANQVSARLIELKSYTNKLPEIEEDIKYDLNELDNVYAEIKNDLQDNVANDEVVEALIQNYRLKLRILEDLLTQLQQSQDKNTKTDEIQIHEL